MRERLANIKVYAPKAALSPSARIKKEYIIYPGVLVSYNIWASCRAVDRSQSNTHSNIIIIYECVIRC